MAIPTASVLDEEKELLLKIEKEKKRLESTMRVADLKKELEALNADTALRTMRKKEEKSRLETKIRDTKEKKSLLASKFSCILVVESTVCRVYHKNLLLLFICFLSLIQLVSLELQSYLKDAASVDICMLLDCTGSMSPYIDAMKSDIVDLVASLGDLYPNIPLRVAFVGYRDHCDGDQRLAIFPFSMAVSDFKTFVGSQRAHGGGDGPEDVFGALKAATELEWAAATRFIFHIGDAPCHGKEFHGGVHDDYPEGDPMGLTAEELLRGVQSRNIQYTFGRICSGTDKMIERFNAILTGFVTTVGVSTPKSMLKSITASVTTSLSVSLSSSATTAEKVDMSTFAVDKRIPNWMTLEAEQINVYEMRDFSSVDSILDSDGIKILKASPRVEKVKVSPLPFDKGSCRLAYRALLLSNSETNIIKVYASRKVVSRSKYESASILTHATAIHLAVAFRGLSLPRGAPTIKFLPIMLVQYVERRDTPYATLEPMINGNWEKYNNNHGLVVPSPSPAHNTNHDIVQAFSHWTYVVSGKRLMVVDCQGVFEATANAFTLTDPAIHCTSDATMFGGTNLGKDGVRRFFETHKCNEYCRALKIASSL